MKKLLSLLLIIATLFLVSSCKKQCDHVDTDYDFLCDICEAQVENVNYYDGNECSHEWLPATCSMDGFCAKCGCYGEKAKGHTPGEFVVNLPAFCEVKGELIKFCTECEAPLVIEDIPALEHEWVDGVCVHCGDIEPEA